MTSSSPAKEPSPFGQKLLLLLLLTSDEALARLEMPSSSSSMGGYRTTAGPASCRCMIRSCKRQRAGTNADDGRSGGGADRLLMRRENKGYPWRETAAIEQ
jgi:hypothetical protein